MFMAKRKAKFLLRRSDSEALELAALRYYALEIERVSIAIYACDADPKRTFFKRLTTTLGKHLHDLKRLQEECKAGKSVVAECRDPFELCADGLCHPPGECS
jgi:hypothetical protein